MTAWYPGGRSWTLVAAGTLSLAGGLFSTGGQSASAAQTRAQHVRLNVTLARRTVSPGGLQTVTVGATPRTSVTVTVSFPNGSAMVQQGQTSRTGLLRWSFVQPPNSITRSSRLASLRASAGPSVHSPVRHYTIGYGPLDVVVPHAGLNTGERARLWIHTAAHTRVTFRLSPQPRPTAGDTNGQGWLLIRYRAAISTRAPATITLTASARLHGKPVSSEAAFVVRPFHIQVALLDPHVLHHVHGVWQPTTHVVAGEAVRFGGHSLALEPAGRVRTCLTGTVRIEGKGSRTLTLRCATSNGTPYLYADTRFARSDAGDHLSTIHISYKGGQASYILPFTVTGR